MERTFKIEKKYINFPVKHWENWRLFHLLSEDKIVRELGVCLASDEPDFWVFMDVTEFKGKTIVLRMYRECEGFSNIFQADTYPGEEDLYKEPLRPQFHFSSRRGWVNDPNGLVYYDGEYHLFYQHNPYGWSWNDLNKSWGHAISDDLVHWKELPDALIPDQLGSVFSGSAVIDKTNITGFKSGKEETMICIYTSAGGLNPLSDGNPFTQSIAFSNDKGRTFIKYERNPVQNEIETENRDPKAIWHEESNQWVIVLHFTKRAMAFFTSKDLKKWEFQSELENSVLVDCPELFQLALDGNDQNKKWILYGGNGKYLIGQFDGKKFKPESKEIKYDYGNCFYASQTFNNIPKEDGRRIQIAWGVCPMPKMPFNHQMLFPVELTLKTTNDGMRMYAKPVKEIKSLYRRRWKYEDRLFKEGSHILFEQKEKISLYDLTVNIDIGNSEQAGILINDIPITYHVVEQKLHCIDREAPLKSINGKLNLRILVDRTTMEIFGNDGGIYMPIRTHLLIKNVYAIYERNRSPFLRSIDNFSEIGAKIGLFNNGGDINLIKLEINELNSIWDN